MMEEQINAGSSLSALKCYTQISMTVRSVVEPAVVPNDDRAGHENRLYRRMRV